MAYCLWWCEDITRGGKDLGVDDCKAFVAEEGHYVKGKTELSSWNETIKTNLDTVTTMEDILTLEVD